jgi:nicotinamide/nicotinate riboside kinase
MPSQTLLIALSGPSSSGKTTLARLLRDALDPHAFILHEDDFYKTDAEIPVVKVADGRELQDWDCLDSVDIEGLKSMLRYIKEHGRVKDGFESKEDKNAVGDVKIDGGAVERWRGKFKGILGDEKRNDSLRIAIIDGFLLYSEDVKQLRDLFDVKILLKADYATVKMRRERRKGYVTLEGFWEDPEGYVDLVVWPNYVKDHSFLFQDSDVDGIVDQDLLNRLGISAMPTDAVGNMTACFDWACSLLSKSMEQQYSLAG